MAECRKIGLNYSSVLSSGNPGWGGGHRFLSRKSGRISCREAVSDREALTNFFIDMAFAKPVLFIGPE